MNTECKLAICVDNKDPKNHGRIRFVDYNRYKNYLSVNRIIDEVETETDGGNKYTPWADGADNVDKLADELISEPFLPRHINIVPLIGQVVRLITDEYGKKLYVGPISNAPTNLTSNYREELTKSRQDTPKNISNNPQDTTISGYNNEQMLLGNNKAILSVSRLGNNEAKTQYPLFQISKFTNSLNYKETTETITRTKDVFLDYIIELDFNYRKKESLTDKNIQCVVSVYDTLSTVTDEEGKKGLTKESYNPYENYTLGSISNQYTVRHILDFNDVNSLGKCIEEILSSYNNKKINFFNPETPSSNDITDFNGNIRLINRVDTKPNNGGAVNDTPDVVINMNNSVIRVSPLDIDKYVKPTLQLQDELLIPKTQPSDTTSLDYVRFNEFNTLIRKVRSYKESRFTGEQELQPRITETIKSVEEEVIDKEITTQTTYADKFLFLSSLNSPERINKGDRGFSNETISKFLSNISNDGLRDYKTYGWLRGEKVLDLINRLITILLNHGHSVGQVEGSINEDTKKLLSNIMGELNDEIDGNKSNKTTKIINHNFRIN